MNRRRSHPQPGPAAVVAGLGAALLVSLAAVPKPALSQTATAGESCAERLTDQLRRFNEKCLTDLVSYVGLGPKNSARVLNESEKYWIKIVRTGDGVRAEAVSKANYPLMKAETETSLKALGWQAPDEEFGNFEKTFAREQIGNGAAAQDLAKALQAYGMSPGEAMSVTAGEQD